MRLNEFPNLTNASRLYANQPNELLQLPQNPQTIYTEVVCTLSRSAIGPYCWFVLDHSRNCIDSAGGMIEYLTKHPKSVWLNTDLDQLPEIWHPEDLGHIAFFVGTLQQYVQNTNPDERAFIKADLYCRMQKSFSNTPWIRLQSFCHFEGSGLLRYTLHFLEDVSHLKKDKEPLMVIHNLYHRTPRMLVCEVPKAKISLTAREREVLRLLKEGFCSKQIAACLGISKNTVENHRQNMLRKTHTQCTTQLVAWAMEERLF